MKILNIMSYCIVYSACGILSAGLKSLFNYRFVGLNFWYQIGTAFYPSLTWRRAANSKKVYLTFDDGPDPKVTPWVLDELRKVGAKATFFVVGDNASRHPEIIKEIKLAGHEIGNHTHHHIKGWRNSAQDYIDDINKCEKTIGETRFFRPPYGQINTKSIPELTKRFEVIMWDVLTKDYLKNLNVESALKRIKRHTNPGSIVVFHDSQKMEHNLKKMLPEYLEFLVKEGYEMGAL